MLSYQHGFHAGNRADILKHAALDTILSKLVHDKSPLFYVETHAGRGRYDLTGKQAQKTGEAESGVLSLLKGNAPRPLKPWMELVRAQGEKAYPGSPALAAARLRDIDRMVFFEKHPAEHKALTQTLGHDPRCLIKKADGYAGALKLSPRRGETMCLFVDPSYETLRDMDALAEWAPRALKRWPRAYLILWLPLFADEREADFGGFLSELADGTITGARWPVDPQNETALSGSAIVAYRIDAETGEALTHIGSSLQSWWSATNQPTDP